MSVEERATFQSRMKAWRTANPEKVRDMAQRHKERHRADVLAANARRERARYQRNLEKERERSRIRVRAWKLANPERKRLYEYVRDHKVRANGGTLTVAQWMAIKEHYRDRCAYCGEKKPLTMDHVVPVIEGGKTDVSNIVPACRSCNSAKGRGEPKVPLRLALL